MKGSRLWIVGAGILLVAAVAWYAGVSAGDILAALATLPFALPVFAIEVPSAAQVADKFVRITSQRQGDYTQGITATPPAKMEAAAVAAAGVYAQGVQQAIADGRFEKGLQGSGAKWRRKAEAVGGARFAQGVTAARDDMAKGIEPYLQELAAITLDPRGPRGSPQNLQRVAVVMQRLNARRRGVSA